MIDQLENYKNLSIFKYINENDLIGNMSCLVYWCTVLVKHFNIDFECRQDQHQVYNDEFLFVSFID